MRAGPAARTGPVRPTRASDLHRLAAVGQPGGGRRAAAKMPTATAPSTREAGRPVRVAEAGQDRDAQGVGGRHAEHGSDRQPLHQSEGDAGPVGVDAAVPQLGAGQGQSFCRRGGQDAPQPGDDEGDAHRGATVHPVADETAQQHAQERVGGRLGQRSRGQRSGSCRPHRLEGIGEASGRGHDRIDRSGADHQPDAEAQAARPGGRARHVLWTERCSAGRTRGGRGQPDLPWVSRCPGSVGGRPSADRRGAAERRRTRAAPPDVRQ